MLSRRTGSACHHLENIAASSTKKDAAKAKGLLKRLKSPKFLTFLMFMIDFTDVIAYLSLSFQADDFIIVDVLPMLENVITSLVEMKTVPGKCVSSLTKGHQYGDLERSNLS